MTDLLAPPPVSTQALTDPSTLTTAQLQREIGHLQSWTEARFVAIEKATDLRAEQFSGIPQEIRNQVEALKHLHSERFTSIAKQFAERDVRGEQASTSSGQALAAALQAAKELVGAQGEASAAAAVKSETSFTKQIDQILTLIQTGNTAIDARITELKERIDRGEGGDNGSNVQREQSRNTRTDHRADMTLIVAVALGAISLISLVLR